MTRRWITFGAVGAAAIAADQATKLWARTSLPTNLHGHGIPVPVVDGFFDWRLSYNTGSAFGLFADMPGARVFLTLVALGAIAGLLWMVAQARDDQKALAWALGLLGGGAVGNLIDRVYAGEVTDFIVWKYHAHEWPVFNIADTALCTGVGLLLFDMMLEARRERRAAGAGLDAAETEPAPRGDANARSASRTSSPR